VRDCCVLCVVHRAEVNRVGIVQVHSMQYYGITGMNAEFLLFSPGSSAHIHDLIAKRQ